MSDDTTPPEVDSAEVYALAKKVVYDRLADRPRSRADLEQALAKKQVPAEVAADVLDRCETAGLVDDAAFARSWIDGRQRGKGLARRALAMELKKHGIDDDIAREALDEIEPDTERQAAHRLVQRKLRSTAGVDEQKRVRRLVGMLARKGYPPGLAYEVVREELGAEAEPIESL